MLVLIAVGLAVAFLALLSFPQAFFCCYTERGRLSLYSDQPFNPVRAQAFLAAVDARLKRSALDDGRPDAIFVDNADWRQRLFMNRAYGAGGVNFYPLTRNVFLRNADIDTDTVYGRSGKATERPRTLTYFATHEIGHTLTAERLGPFNLWNWRLPVWIREGSADFIGFGGGVDVESAYRRYRTHDPFLDPRSGHYDRYRLLVAYFIERKGWTMDRLLSSNLAMPGAEKIMNADLDKRRN